MTEQKKPAELAIVPPGAKRETYITAAGEECYVDTGFWTERYMAAQGKKHNFPMDLAQEWLRDEEAKRPRKPFIVRAEKPREP